MNSNLDCAQAQALFYDLGEAKLSAGEAVALRAHEAACSACRHEFKSWRSLRAVLQDPGLSVTPPAQFTAGVMARITASEPETGRERPGIFSNLKNKVWPRAIAAAAIILALLTGTVATQPQLLPGSLIAHNPGSQQPGQTNNGPLTTDKTGDNQVTPSDKEPDQIDQTPETPEEVTPEQPTTTPSVSTAEKPATGNTGNTERVFLDKERVITSSLLKVSVDNLAQARRTALEMAKSEQAALTSELTTQNNGQKDLILRLTVPRERTKVLHDRLAGLGTVVMEDTTSQDITAGFSRTLAEYQAQKAQQAAAPEGERERFNSQIENLEQQLHNWDTESEKHVFILLLEQ